MFLFYSLRVEEKTAIAESLEYRDGLLSLKDCSFSIEKWNDTYLIMTSNECRGVISNESERFILYSSTILSHVRTVLASIVETIETGNLVEIAGIGSVRLIQ